MHGVSGGRRDGGDRTIRVFRADDMAHTPFSRAGAVNPILAAAGLAFVEDPEDADIILARRVRYLKEYGGYDKAFVIWTHEPRFSFGTDTVQHSRLVRNPIHVMNAYTGGIYNDEFYDFSVPRIEFDSAMRVFDAKPLRAVILATYCRPPTPAIWDGVDHDLQQYRQDLALYLKDCGFCDIHGRKWPPEVEISGNTRELDWRRLKKEVLKGYAINIAFENTLIPKYVTEKIWDAIAGACLPVYHGGNGIYRLLPRGSFIDSEGTSVEALAEEILNMGRSELSARYEACLKAYIDLYADDLRAASHRECHRRTALFLQEVITAHARRKPAREWALARAGRRFDAALRRARRVWRHPFSPRAWKYPRK